MHLGLVEGRGGRKLGGWTSWWEIDSKWSSKGGCWGACAIERLRRMCVFCLEPLVAVAKDHESIWWELASSGLSFSQYIPVLEKLVEASAKE